MKKHIPQFHFISFTILLVFIVNTLSAQDTKTGLVKPSLNSNAIFGDIGINLEVVGDAWFTGTVFYERMFKLKANKTDISTFARVGFGGMAYWGGDATFAIAQVGILTGAKNNHLEASLGVTSLLNESYKIFPISTSIGYRRQKPGGHFIFRTGVAWPEALYIGIGTSF